jgi:hypothetical protein
MFIIITVIINYIYILNRYYILKLLFMFFILLLIDLCIGFHSPHGWEIVIGSFLEHLGFACNKHIISCFVSTFPVILNIVLKYWIFRHLNRTSHKTRATKSLEDIRKF